MILIPYINSNIFLLKYIVSYIKNVFKNVILFSNISLEEF